MTGFPETRFPENARGTVPPMAGSSPEAPDGLEPGVTACAAVRTPEGGRKESTETVRDLRHAAEGGRHGPREGAR